MGRLRAVLDTNVLIAGFVGKGLSRELVLAAVRRRYSAVVCPLIIGEFARKMTEKFPDSDVKRAVKLMLNRFEIVPNEEIARRFVRGVVRDDPDDDTTISRAVAGDAKYVVTYDKSLLGVSSFKKGRLRIRIVAPADFLRVLESSD